MSKAIVTLENVELSIKGAPLLSSLDFVGTQHSITTIRGTNGCGKTSFLRLIGGLLPPSEGSRSGPSTCAYVPAALDPPPVPVGQWVAAIPRKNRTSPEKALQDLGFHGDLARSCKKLSFGNLRKMLLAEALSSGESLIILDEAMMGLDQPGVEGLAELIKKAAELGSCIVLAEQHTHETPWATDTYFIETGSLVKNHRRSGLGEVRFKGNLSELNQVRTLAQTLGLQEVTE